MNALLRASMVDLISSSRTCPISGKSKQHFRLV